MLVRSVSIYYYAQVNAISTGQVSLDFNSTFGGNIEAFHERKNRITDAMWQHELGDDASVDFETLRAWLRPCDLNLQILVNRLYAPGHRDEYTCEWFQRHLLDFSRSKEDGLSIVGPAGCGKSFLFRWIIERLQRPLGKNTYETLFYAIGRSSASARLPLFLFHSQPPFTNGQPISHSRYQRQLNWGPWVLTHLYILLAFIPSLRHPLADVFNRSRHPWRDFIRRDS